MSEPTSDAWTQIRYDYEHTNRPVEDICAEHGISSGTLRDRVRRWRWTRRRVPIPREGPPAMAAPQGEMIGALEPARYPALLHGTEARRLPPLGLRLRGDEWEEPPQQPPSPALPHSVGESDAAPPIPSGHGANEPADSDPASIAPRLQSAVARVLPAIETIIARLAGEPRHPRETEQTARALGTLTRTLRELNALLSQHPARAAYDDDDMPEDIDAFRIDLARRIDAFVKSRQDAREAADAGGEAPAER